MLYAFTGSAYSGKTTAANILVEMMANHNFEFVIIPFAKPLKDLARDYFGWDGKKDERGRRLLQTLGTEVGRKYDNDIWVKKWKLCAQSNFDAKRGVIVDDCRFDNELDAVRSFGGKVIRIHAYPEDRKSRANLLNAVLSNESESHASESLPKYYDHHINNTSTIQSLRISIENLFKDCQWDKLAH